MTAAAASALKTAAGNRTSRGKIRQETSRLLGELESLLLEMGSVSKDRELAGRICRALHAIHRAGVRGGFDGIAAMTGEIVPLFDLVCRGRMAVTTELTGLALLARDRMRRMLDGDGAGSETFLAVLERMRHLRADAGFT